jgi:AcrR family transcriptional regulator
MARSPSDAQSPKKPVGRPRLLTVTAIIDAASSIDPAEFNMAAVARKLGVSAGTLYTYFDGRDDLERQVALRRLRRSRMADVGQAWQEVIRAMILNALRVFVTDRNSVIRYMEGTVGLVDGLEEMEDVIGMLVRRGFSIEQATDAHRSASLLALGLAVAHIHKIRAAERGRTHEALIPRRLEAADREPLPTVAQAAERLMDDETYFSPDSPIDQLVAGLEAQLSRS